MFTWVFDLETLHWSIRVAQSPCLRTPRSTLDAAQAIEIHAWKGLITWSRLWSTMYMYIVLPFSEQEQLLHAAAIHQEASMEKHPRTRPRTLHGGPYIQLHECNHLRYHQLSNEVNCKKILKSIHVRLCSQRNWKKDYFISIGSFFVGKRGTAPEKVSFPARGWWCARAWDVTCTVIERVLVLERNINVLDMSQQEGLLINSSIFCTSICKGPELPLSSAWEFHTPFRHLQRVCPKMGKAASASMDYAVTLKAILFNSRLTGHRPEFLSECKYARKEDCSKHSSSKNKQINWNGIAGIIKAMPLVYTASIILHELHVIPAAKTMPATAAAQPKHFVTKKSMNGHYIVL